MFGKAWVDNAGTLYCLDKHLTLSPRLKGVTISNGLVWKGDAMYFIDTPKCTVDRYSYDPATSVLTNGTVAARFPADGSHGLPDGMALDADGNIWVACFNVRSREVDWLLMVESVDSLLMLMMLTSPTPLRQLLCCCCCYCCCYCCWCFS
jgi:sugar lactone lactonase YvrE